MNPRLALLFAVVGVCLLLSISFFISAHQVWLVALASVLSVLFIGAGFIVKARTREKDSRSGKGFYR